jgi:hypothetical protein
MRTLFATAGLTAALHVVGLVLALACLRPGSPAVPLDDRLAYLAAHPAGWSVGWGVWMLCALSLVTFLAALRSRAPHANLASLAVTLAAAGAAVDLICDVGQIVVLPDVAAWKPAQPALFVIWERWLGATGAIAANGLYSLAALAASLGLRSRVPTFVVALGALTCAAGFLMVVAGFTGDMRQLEVSVGATLVSYLMWTGAVTWALSPRAARRG